MKFEQVIDRHYQGVFVFALHLCKNKEDAEDLTQHTFLTFAKKHLNLPSSVELKPWLFKVCKNQFIDTYRKKTRFTHCEYEALEVPQTVNPAPSIGFDFDHATQALLEVPVKYRAPLSLFLIEGFTYREIADILNKPIGTIMSRISRGRDFLNTHLSATL